MQNTHLITITTQSDNIKAKNINLEENSKNKTILEKYTDINEFKKGYQLCTYEYVIKNDGNKIIVHTTSIKS